jgi:hypothetical protein
MYKTDDYDMWYEDAGEGRAALHCLVHTWTPRTARLLQEAADQMVADMVLDGYHTAYAVGAQHPDFCEFMGGEYLETFFKDNVAYEVYQWELLRQ